MAGVHAMVGVLSGYPVSASGSRTALAIASRARSQVYSLVAALCVVAVLFFAGPLMAPLPWAALVSRNCARFTSFIEYGGTERI
jgi:SulP family sulfate permease